MLRCIASCGIMHSLAMHSLAMHGSKMDHAAAGRASSLVLCIEIHGTLVLAARACSTNLSKRAPSVHETGLLWKLVRASMTIIGEALVCLLYCGHFLAAAHRNSHMSRPATILQTSDLTAASSAAACTPAYSTCTHPPGQGNLQLLTNFPVSYA